jgi:hypothetical protein
MASNKSLVPEAKDALSRFKMEAANEEGVHSALKLHTKEASDSTNSRPPRAAVFRVFTPCVKQSCFSFVFA